MNGLKTYLKDLSAYQSARGSSYGEDLLYLDANERLDGNYAAYPDPVQREARQAVAAFRGVQFENVILGNGSDECLEWLFKLFVEPGDSVVIPSPTYGMYKTLASAYGAKMQFPALLEDGSLDRAELEPLLQTAKIVLLSSPNNPTGGLLPDEDLEWVLEQTDCPVLLDEAYIDFAGIPSKASWLERYPQLVITQTFSKAFGLAGLRIGALLASAELISWVERIKMPYNVGTPAQEAVVNALEDIESVRAYTTMIATERERYMAGLRLLKSVDQVYDSAANFIFFSSPQAAELAQELRDQGILIRQFERLPGFLRWTLAGEAINQQVFNLIQEFSYETRTIY